MANPVVVKLELLEREAIVESFEALDQVFSQAQVLRKQKVVWLVKSSGKVK